MSWLRCFDDGDGDGGDVDGSVGDSDGEKFKTIMRALRFLLSNRICHSHGNDSCALKATQSSTPNTYCINTIQHTLYLYNLYNPAHQILIV